MMAGFEKQERENQVSKLFKEESVGFATIHHSLPSAKLFLFQQHEKCACPVFESSKIASILFQHQEQSLGSPDQHQAQIWMRLLGCGSLNVGPLGLETLN